MNDGTNEPLAEANDPVWDLLARASRPEPDAWFTVRTLARCRHEGPLSRARRLQRIWRWTLASGLGVGLAIVLFVQNRPATPEPTNQQGVQEAFDVLASLDSDSDSSNSSSWQDPSY